MVFVIPSLGSLYIDYFEFLQTYNSYDYAMIYKSINSGGYYWAYWYGTKYKGQLPLYWHFDSEFIWIKWYSDCCSTDDGFTAEVKRYG